MILLVEETAIGAKLALAHGGTGVKVGPGEIKTPLASPPTEKLFLGTTYVTCFCNILKLQVRKIL